MDLTKEPAVVPDPAEVYVPDQLRADIVEALDHARERLPVALR